MQTLGQLQREFSVRFAELLHLIQAKGFECTLNEVKRSDEQALINSIGVEGREKLAALCRNGGFAALGDAIANNGKNGGVLHSVHQLSLAADINLFKDGKYLAMTDDHRVFGEWWEKQHDLARWGGRWGDGNHYSFEFNGVK